MDLGDLEGIGLLRVASLARGDGYAKVLARLENFPRLDDAHVDFDEAASQDLRTFTQARRDAMMCEEVKGKRPEEKEP